LARPLCRSNSDAAEIQKLAAAFNLLLAMVKVHLDLPAFINALAPNGGMHFVGVKFVPIIGE
jgi:D-arabinose 1-dehydrogenase-like Zn-dependent alcohol dehydrogenase